MVSGVYSYLQPHQAAHIKYVQLFVCQPYIKSLKKYIPTQLVLSPIPKVPAATQLPLYQEGKCDRKKVKMERGSCISHFPILQKHNTTLTYCLGKDQVNNWLWSLFLIFFMVNSLLFIVYTEFSITFHWAGLETLISKQKWVHLVSRSCCFKCHSPINGEKLLIVGLGKGKAQDKSGISWSGRK